jgi:hypothetical protein
MFCSREGNTRDKENITSSSKRGEDGATLEQTQSRSEDH